MKLRDLLQVHFARAAISDQRRSMPGVRRATSFATAVSHRAGFARDHTSQTSQGAGMRLGGVLFFGVTEICPRVLVCGGGLTTRACVIWTHIQIIRHLGWQSGRLVVTGPVILGALGDRALPAWGIHAGGESGAARELGDAARSVFGAKVRPLKARATHAAPHGACFGSLPVLACVAASLSSLGLEPLLRRARESLEYS